MARAVAWLGGAGFVGSLALVAWWYFVALGAARTWRGWAPVVLDVLLITAFASHHSIFARESIKQRLSIIPERMMRSFYVWIASALLTAVVLLWRPIGGELYDASGVRALAHTAVQLFGVWLIARSVAGLDPLELAGIRQANDPARPDRPGPIKEALQVTGPYAWVRHPLYLGWMLALFGAAHMTSDRLTFAAFTSLYLVIAVPWEERSLRQSFGDAYARYAQRVRWRIVPYVY